MYDEQVQILPFWFWRFWLILFSSVLSTVGFIQGDHKLLKNVFPQLLDFDLAILLLMNWRGSHISNS